MSIETTLPYSWLRTIPDAIKLQDEIPLFGNPPPFPWEAFNQELAKIFEQPDLKVVCTNIEWKTSEELLSGFGETPAIHPISVAPLSGLSYFIFSKEDLSRLFQTLIPEASLEETEKEWDEDWADQFYLFLSSQAIHAFQKSNFDSSLAPKLLQDASLPASPCLCFDIEINFGSKSFNSRLAISPEMRSALKQRYTQKTLSYPPGISEAITADVHVVIGGVTLPKNEWKKASSGDFLILDSCSLVPGDDKGRVVLKVNNSPIFRAKIKDGKLKLLEYPLLQEVQIPMANHEDDEFDDTFETEDETISESDQTEDQDFEDELEEEEEVFEEEKTPLEAAKDLLSKTAPALPLVNPENIPLTVSVEIGRIQMSIQQLMQLAPGNMLDLDISPENGVDLVVNGRCIGKGELLKLGETLGVRILDKA